MSQELNPQRRGCLRILLFVIILALVLITGQMVLPEDQTLLGWIFFAAVVGYGIFNAISNASDAAEFIELLINMGRSLVFQPVRALKPAALRDVIQKRQEEIWIQRVFNHATVHDPVSINLNWSQPDLEERAVRFAKDRVSRGDPPGDAADPTRTTGLWQIQNWLSGRRLPRPQQTEEPASGNVIQAVTLEDAYHAAGRQLIVLGKAGSGKTIALLQLLKALLIRDVASQRGQIPFVFQLGSWAQKKNSNHKLTLSEWFVSEIMESLERTQGENSAEQVEMLVQTRDLVFLIDGFDEVPAGFRPTLLEEIYAFSASEGALNAQAGISIVLCSRPEEFHSAQAGIADAPIPSVTIDDLPLNRVWEYLSDGTDDGIYNYEAIRELIQREKTLQDLARKPFTLNAIAHAYNNPGHQDIQVLRQAINNPAENLGDPAIPKVLLRRYIAQLLKKANEQGIEELSGAIRHYQETVDPYLAWVAHKLSSSEYIEDDGVGSKFLVEYLQPKWLDSLAWQWAYHITSRALGAMAIVVAVSFVLSGPLDFLLIGGLAGVVIGIIDMLTLQGPLGALKRRLSVGRYFIVRTLILYGFTTAALALTVGLVVPSPTEDRILNGMIALSGVTLASYFPFFTTAIYTTRDIRFGRDIELVQNISNLTLRTALRYALVGAVLVGTVVGVYASALSNHSINSVGMWVNDVVRTVDQFWVRPWTIGTALGLVGGGLVGGVIGLLSEVKAFRLEERLRPNQGIRSSLLNGVRFGLPSFFVFSAAFSLIYWLIYTDTDAIRSGLQTGAAFGAIAGLWYGGLDAIHHLVLRLFLFLSRQTPWNLTGFLSVTSRCNLTREIGASYSFSHEYLREFYHRQASPAIGLRITPTLVFLTLSTVLLGATFARPMLREQLYLLGYRVSASVQNATDTEGVYSVDGPAAQTIDGGHLCVDAGQSIQVVSRGIIRSGNYFGYVSPEGSEVGVFGIPIGDTYDVVPEIQHSALMCKLSTDPDDGWQQCAYRTRPFMLEWAGRSHTFAAERAGCLEFDINGIEVEKRSGAYFVQATVVD